MSPEHKFLEKYKDRIKNLNEVKVYQEEAKHKSEIERTDMTKDKTGVKIDGLTAINPVNGKEVEIWISDYVLASYGTGAIMAVPAHDDRDFAFAKKFGIDIIPVIKDPNVSDENLTDTPYVGDGVMINSDFLNGIATKEEAISKMLKFLEEKNIGKKTVNYRLQDWIFSRQRFWGEPIPMINCPECGWVPVPDKDLPVLLPDIQSYEPTDDGESPLANIEDWVNVKCPCCGHDAKRETDTMPNWAGSSWYWLRYMDAHNPNEIASKEALDYWGKVDLYDGGMEHATRHLLYARFWNIFLHEQGLVPNSEPFLKRISHGMILGSNGEKMSKSKGNVVNPNDMVAEYGADALRLYEMFIGDYAKDAAWNENGLKGCRKFLNRVWALQDKVTDKEEYTKSLESALHKAIKKVTHDIETLDYNTAVSALMILLNEMDKESSITRLDYRIMLQLLNPFAPHITEELWSKYGTGKLLAYETWPEYDESKTIDDTIELPVQMNGKLKGTVMISLDSDEQTVKDKVHSELAELLSDKNIVKEIYVKNKIFNIVVK